MRAFWLEQSESQRLETLAFLTRLIAGEQTTRLTGGYDFSKSVHKLIIKTYNISIYRHKKTFRTYSNRYLIFCAKSH